MTGRGVTVAVIDSGLWNQQGPLQSAPGQSHSRVLAQYDVILARQNPHYYLPPLFESYSRDINDPYGHGTHVTSIIASSGVATTGRYQGVAPGVNLVSVRALDSNGQGLYSDVISAVQWVINQRLRYGIRVLNLSLRCAALGSLLAGPAQSSRDGRLGFGNRGGHRRGQSRSGSLVHQRAGQRSLCHHGRRRYRQLSSDAAGAVSVGLFFIGRSDLRGICEARCAGHGRPHHGLRTQQRHLGAGISFLVHRALQRHDHVRHLAGSRSRERRRGADAAGEPAVDAGSGEVPPHVGRASGGQLFGKSGLQRFPAGRGFGGCARCRLQQCLGLREPGHQCLA